MPDVPNPVLVLLMVAVCLAPLLRAVCVPRKKVSR